MVIVKLIGFSPINICSKSPHNHTACEVSNAKIASIWPSCYMVTVIQAPMFLCVPSPRGQTLPTGQGGAGVCKLYRHKWSSTLAACPSVLCKAKCINYEDIIEGITDVYWKRMLTEGIHPLHNKHHTVNCGWQAICKNALSYLYF